MAEITYNYLLDPNIQFQDKAGKNNVNGFLRVYRNGTDTRAMTYRDFQLTANPADIPLDNNGRAVVIVDVAYEYRLEVYSREGALLWTQYPLMAMGVGDIIVNGLREVAHDSTLTGDGTEESPLGAVPEIFVAVYGQTSIYAVGAAVSAGKIVMCGRSSGPSVNYAIYTGNAYGVHRFSYSEDSAVYTISLSPDGGNGTWAITSKTIPSGGISSVAHNQTLVGDGTSLDPLGVDEVAVGPQWNSTTWSSRYSGASGIVELNSDDVQSGEILIPLDQIVWPFTQYYGNFSFILVNVYGIQLRKMSGQTITPGETWKGRFNMATINIDTRYEYSTLYITDFEFVWNEGGNYTDMKGGWSAVELYDRSHSPGGKAYPALCFDFRDYKSSLDVGDILSLHMEILAIPRRALNFG